MRPWPPDGLRAAAQKRAAPPECCRRAAHRRTPRSHCRPAQGPSVPHPMRRISADTPWRSYAKSRVVMRWSWTRVWPFAVSISIMQQRLATPSSLTSRIRGISTRNQRVDPGVVVGHHSLHVRHAVEQRGRDAERNAHQSSGDRVKGAGRIHAGIARLIGVHVNPHCGDPGAAEFLPQGECRGDRRLIERAHRIRLEGDPQHRPVSPQSGQKGARERWRAATWRAEREVPARWAQKSEIAVTFVPLGDALRDARARVELDITPPLCARPGTQVAPARAASR